MKMSRKLNSSSPITHDHSIKAPLISENPLRQFRILTCMQTIYPIVSRHKTPRLYIPLRNLKWHQIDFPERSFRDNRVPAHPLVLLVITYKLFDGLRNAVGLNSLHGHSAHRASQERVFTERFESAAAE